MLKTFILTYEIEKHRNWIEVKALHRESAKNKLQAVNPKIEIINCKYLKG